MHDELLQHQAFLERLARRLVMDEAAAQDLVQDTWLLALTRPRPRPGPLRGWLGKVARHLAIERARGSRRRGERERDAARNERIEGGQERVDRRLDFQALLLERLRALPEAQRYALSLRYVEDLAPHAIARQLGVSVHTVKARLRRGLATLREGLDRRTGGDRAVWAVILFPELGRSGAATALGSGVSAVLVGGGVLMSMVTKVAAAMLVMMALLGGWWLTSGEEEAVPSLREELVALPSSRTPADASSAASGAEEIDGALAQAREPLAEAAVRSEAPALPFGDLQAVRVVERSSGGPLPGAEVLWLYVEQQDAATAERVSDVARAEQLLEERGEMTHADERGIARLPRGMGELLIVGRSPGLYGWKAQPGDVPGELRLELGFDAHVDVEVVDHRGSPVAGIGVGRRLAPTVASVFTDEQGHARLPHLLAAGPMGRMPRSLEVGVVAVLGEPVGKELDPEDLPRAPVRLVLPPTGSVAVSVRDRQGDPVESGWVQVKRNVRPHLGGSERFEGGGALFEHVEVGLELRVTAGDAAQHQSTIHLCAGPAAFGQRITVEVRLGYEMPVLRMRALDEHGAPLAGVELRTWLSTPYDLGTGFDQDVRTDARGQFELLINPYLQRSGYPRLLRVRQAPAAGTPARETERELDGEYSAHLHDLGDLHLAPAPLVAAGVMVDERGEPVAGATASVWLFAADMERGVEDSGLGLSGQSGAAWRAAGLEARSDADGRFVLHGNLPPGRTAVVAGSPGLVSDSVECQRGAIGLRLRLRDPATLAGRLEIDTATMVERLRLHARLESSAGIPADLLGVAEGWTEACKRAQSFVRRDGSFAIPDLKPGRWTLSVRLVARGSSVLREIEGILVRSGEAALDPRLDPLDLRRIVRFVRVELIPPPGDPLPSGWYGWREAGTVRPPTQSATAGREIELLLLDAPLDVDIVLRGYRQVRLDSVTEDQRVELVPGLPVRVRLPADLRLPRAPPHLVAAVSIAGPRDLVNVTSDRLAFDERGELSWIAGAPGPARVRLRIEKELGSRIGAVEVGPGWREITLVETTAEQVLILDVTQAELDAALTRMKE